MNLPAQQSRGNDKVPWWASRWAALWPLLAAAVLVGLSVYAYYEVRPDAEKLPEWSALKAPTDKAKAEMEKHKEAARVELRKLFPIIWGTSALLFLLIGLVSLVFLASTLWNTMCDAKDRRVWYLVLLGAAVPVAMMVMLPNSPFSGFESAFVTSPLVRKLPISVVPVLLGMWISTLTALTS